MKISDVDAKIEHCDNGIGVSVEALFEGVKGLASTKTVIGEPVEIADVVLVPLIEVNTGIASGMFGKNAKDNGVAAASTKIAPVAILVLDRGKIRLVNIKNQDAVTRLLDLIPEAVDIICGKFNISREGREAAEHALRNPGENYENINEKRKYNMLRKC